MTVKRDPSKTLQFGFLGLLFISILLGGYWITDNVRYTANVRDRLDSLTQTDGRRFSELIAELDEESVRRSNRYLWEGGFFLAVLLGGMAVLTRTIRHDAELRRRQQNFLAAVSHEFKSPLASMRLAAETLVLRAEPDSQRLGQRILDDGERLLRMIDNLLDTTRLEEGRHTLEPQRIELAQMAEQILAEVVERAKQHAIAIDVDVGEGFSLSVDRTALETVLRNIVDNAIKACASGSGHSIKIAAERVAGRVVLTVDDDGLGFPPEDAAMMFEKFYRLGDELRRSTPGTGLGLYIVKRLVDLMGAEVRAASAGPGRGARVTVTWPESALR